MFKISKERLKDFIFCQPDSPVSAARGLAAGQCSVILLFPYLSFSPSQLQLKPSPTPASPSARPGRRGKLFLLQWGNGWRPWRGWWEGWGGSREEISEHEASAEILTLLTDSRLSSNPKNAWRKLPVALAALQALLVSAPTWLASSPACCLGSTASTLTSSHPGRIATS